MQGVAFHANVSTNYLQVVGMSGMCPQHLLVLAFIRVLRYLLDPPDDRPCRPHFAS